MTPTPTQAFTRLLTHKKSAYARPCGWGIGLTTEKSRHWDTLYPYFEKRNLHYAREFGYKDCFTFDRIGKGMEPIAENTRGGGFLWDLICNPVAPFYLEIKDYSPLFNGNDSMTFSTGLESTIYTLFDNLLKNDNQIISFIYEKKISDILSVYRCIPINISKILQPNEDMAWQGCYAVDSGMRVIEHGKKNVGSERFFDRRYQVKGTKEQADYENDLSFIWIQKWRKYKRLKLKFSALQVYCDRRYQNKNIKSLLVDLGATTCNEKGELGITFGKVYRGIYFDSNNGFQDIKRTLDTITT